MVDPTAFETMEELMDEVGGSIGLTSKEYFDQAKDAYEYLGVPDGNIKLIGKAEPEVYTADEDTLAKWNGDNATRSYGIDASTTQERDFSNGLRVLIANAKAGVIGDGHHPLGDENHIVVGVYDRDGETSLETNRFKDTQSVRADLKVLTADDPDRTRRLVKSITRLLAEGRHINRVISETERVDKSGLLFVDGPIYPPLVISEVIARHQSGNDNAWTDVFGQTVGNYIDAATWSLDTANPLIGIVKDMDSSSLVTDLKKKIDKYGSDDMETPWSTDKQFLTDLLQSDSIGTYVYTDWFVEEQRFTRVSDAGDQFVDPLAGAPQCEHSTDQYSRAFFFVHNPRTNTITRIETPRGLITDKTSREYVQRRALAEIAKTGGTAEAIKRADKEARISRKNQERLFSKLYSQMQEVRSYNRDHRGAEYLGEDEI